MLKRSLFIFLIFSASIFLTGCSDSSDDYDEYDIYDDDRYIELKNENESLIEALNKANSNIEDAKSSAWESYDDMGEALDYLETVEPY